MRASSSLIYFGMQAAPSGGAGAGAGAGCAGGAGPPCAALPIGPRSSQLRCSRVNWRLEFQVRGKAGCGHARPSDCRGSWCPLYLFKAQLYFFQMYQKKKKSTFHKKLRTAGGDSLAFYWDFELGLLPGALWSTGMQVPPDCGADSCRCRSGTQQEVLPGGGPEGPGPSPCRLLSRANLL